MKTLLTTIAAAMFFTAACTQTEKQEPMGVSKSGGDCVYEDVLAKLANQNDCRTMHAIVEPCVGVLCKQELAEVVNYADSIATVGSFGPCDWSWLPEGLPCE